MRVAITGASGFVGNRTAEVFGLRSIHEVVPVVHSPSSLALAGRFAPAWRIANHTDAGALARAFEGCECVVHTAFGGRARAMSRAVYRAAQSAGVRRIVVLSSASVYNQNVAPGTTEASPLPSEPSIGYNTTKIVADQAFRDERARGTTEVTFLMPSVVFGPRSQWVAGVARQIVDGTASLIDDGRGVCNTVYIDNLVEAIRLSLDAPAADNEAFFVSDAETVTWAEFYRPIIAAFGATLGDVHALHNPSLQGESRKERLRNRLSELVDTDVVRRIKPHVPRRLMTLYRAVVVRPLRDHEAASDEWAPPPAAPAPQIAYDLALLQQSTYKLPNDKAARLLGYVPPVAFADGMRRSVAWLGFAGYPVAARGERAAGPPPDFAPAGRSIFNPYQ